MDGAYLTGALAAMAVATFACRAAPFWLLRTQVGRPWLAFVGRFLPPAVMSVLVLYCLKDTSFAAPPHGLPQVAAVVLTVALHVWRRNALLSIATGTGAYMVLTRLPPML